MPCLVCGKSLPSGRTKYCSRECGYKGNHTIVDTQSYLRALSTIELVLLKLPKEMKRKQIIKLRKDIRRLIFRVLTQDELDPNYTMEE